MIAYCRKCLRLFPPEQPSPQGSCPFDSGDLVSDALLGSTVGDYRITGIIGEGGMGVVFAAEHSTLKRRAAFKVLRGELVADKQEAARFTSEARIVSRLGHPNIIDIFDIGELPDGRLYYVMELLSGRPLSAMMKRERLPFAVFLPILQQTCAGLEAAHAENIVHRDLKPDNLFLVERPGEAPTVRVLDFGVAKVLGHESAEAKLTRTGHIVGTPQYMAPEQIDGSSEIDRRTDIYALGVILYELATGSLPFRGETVGQLLKAHLVEEAPKFERNPAALAPGAPPALEAVIFKALAKQPQDRYPTARALTEDLERVAAGVVPDAASWWQGELQRRETLVKFGGAATAVLGPATQMTAVQQGTLAGTLLIGPQARRWQVLIGGVAAGVVALLLLGGALIWKRGVEVRQAEERIAAEKRRAVQAAKEAEARKKKKIDILDLRSQALAAVQEGLKDGDPTVRGRALVALTQGRDPRHRSLIEPLLGDADTGVVGQAAAALAQIGARGAAPAIAARAGGGEGRDAGLLVPLGDALDRLGDPMGLTLLRKVLRGKDPAAQVRAAQALVERGDAAAKKRLQKQLKQKGLNEAEAVTLLARLAKAGERGAREELGRRVAGEAPPDVRFTGTVALARLGDEEARGRLGELAKKQGPLQVPAARVLAEIADDAGGYDLFRRVFLDDKQPLPGRMAAAEGLGFSGEKAGAKLLAGVLPKGAVDALLRLAAAGAILQIAGGDPQLLAQQSLSWAAGALTDADWSVRESAVALLGDADPGQAVPLLSKAIRDTQPEVRSSAAKALGRTRVRGAVTVLAGALGDEIGGVRVTALRAIGHVGAHLRQRGESPVEDAVAEQIKTAMRGRADGGEAGEQVVAAAALLRLGDESRKGKLKEGLGADDPEVRKLAIEEAAADPQTAKTALSAGLADPSFAVRLRAAQELAAQGSKEGVPVLREALGKRGPESLLAYGALKKLGEEASPPGGIAGLLEAADVGLRVQATEAVGQLPAAEALPLLKKGARDPAAAVRRKVVEVAAELPAPGGAGVPPGLPVLKLLLGDPDVAVRSRAGALVARLTPKEPELPAPKAEGKVDRATEGAAPAVVTPDLAPAAAAPDLAPAAQAAAPDLAPAAAAQVVTPDLAPGGRSGEAAAPGATGTGGPGGKDREGTTTEGKPEGKPETKESRQASNREEAQIKLAAAELFSQNGKYEKSAREFEAARKLDPKLPVYFSLGDAYRRWADSEGDLTKQKKLIQKAIDAYRKAKEPKAKAYIEELRERLQ